MKVSIRKISIIFLLALQFCFVTGYASTCDSTNIDGVK